uniref:Uncharacterized protein n=1 Tax=Physcomitrium patens TaxID=3218 RepID=A0A2K1L456_PHYPA|nr:hypothetical protein PHYPA_003602 [Physcomitrium patens]
MGFDERARVQLIDRKTEHLGTATSEPGCLSRPFRQSGSTDVLDLVFPCVTCLTSYCGRINWVVPDNEPHHRCQA